MPASRAVQTFDRPLEGVEDLGQVVAHRGLGPDRISSLQGGEDRLVLLQGTLRPPWAKDRLVLETDALGLEAGQEAAGRGMLGRRPDLLVERRGQLRVAARIPSRDAVARL